MKNTKGITLIQLTITIVVLIILATIGISLSIAENGIFIKAKQAKENYQVAVNEEKLMIANLEEQIDKEASSTVNNGDDNNNDGTITTNNGEYFFHSINGFTNTLGTGRINSLFGLTPTIYEPVLEEELNYCRYEKQLTTPFDLSGEFEISFKNILATTSISQMGGFNIRFQKLNNENVYENVIGIGVGDGWAGSADISTGISYNGTSIYSNKATSTTQRYCTTGVIGDGKNIKVYCEDTLLTTVAQESLSFDKIVMNFYQYRGYKVVSKNYLERLYYGDIKYYKDII